MRDHRNTLSVKLVTFLRSRGFTVTVTTTGDDIDTAIVVAATGDIGGKPSTVEWNVSFNGDVEGKMIVGRDVVVEQDMMYHFSSGVHEYYKKFDSPPPGRTWNKLVETLLDHGFTEISPGTAVDDYIVKPVSCSNDIISDPYRHPVTVRDLRDTSKRCSVYSGHIGDGHVIVFMAERDPTVMLKNSDFIGMANQISKKFRDFYGLFFLDGALLFDSPSITKVFEQVDRYLGMTHPEIISEMKREELDGITREVDQMKYMYHRSKLSNDPRYRSLVEKRDRLVAEMETMTEENR